MNGTSDYEQISKGLNGYQAFTTKTAAVYWDADLIGGSEEPEIMRLGYCLGKLTGEAGEANEKLWKHLRDSEHLLKEDGPYLTDAVRGAIAAELGDVLWYVAQASRCLGIDLGDVGIGNLEKLRSRAARGVLKGSGDKR